MSINSVLSSAYSAPDPVKVTTLTKIFEEEPVGLDTFIKDSKFLGMSGGLSPIQYAFVQHSERVYKKDLYPLMAEEFGGYWEESKDVRMTNLISAEWGKGCIAADEEIYDSRSGKWRVISEIEEDFRVQGTDEVNPDGDTSHVAGQSVFSRGKTSKTYSASTPFKRGRGNILKVNLSSGASIRVYEGHLFAGWSDENLPYKNRYLKANPVWKAARDLKIGDHVASLNRVDVDNSVAQDPREVELVGYWIGDGHMPGTKSTDLGFIVDARNVELIARYEELVNSYDDLYITKTIMDSGAVYLRINSNKHYMTYGKDENGDWRSNELRALVKQSGLFSSRAWDKRVPGSYFSLPLDQLATLLSALMDTDGSLFMKKSVKPDGEAYYSPAMEYGTTSEGLAKDFNRLLLRFGVSGNLTTKKTSYTYKGEKLAGRTFYRVTVNDRIGVKKLASVLKLHDAKEVLRKEFLQVPDGKVQQQGQEDVKWLTVKSVESLGEGDYWDINVPEAGSYVAGTTAIYSSNSGKDMSSRIISLRIAYLLMCLRSPQNYFGMPASDSIHMLNIAANAPQAQRAFFEPMTRAVKHGWFADKAEPKKSSIMYAKNLEAISGHSSVDGQEGLNLILGVADEIDAFKTRTEMVGLGRRAREASTSAEAILDMLKTSASTRFPEVYKQVTISFPRYKGSKIQQLTAAGVEDNQRFGRDSNYFVSGPHATWVVNPLRKKEDFAMDYMRDPVAAAAKYECAPADSSNPYFRDPKPFYEAEEDFEEPITVTYELRNNISPETGAETQSWEPIFEFADWFQPSPGALYAMHGDLAVKGDRAGVAMSHVIDWEERDVTFINDQNLVDTRAERLPIVRNDFTIGFAADIGSDPAREIQIRWARELAFELIKRGFNIARFSFDGFQSVDSMQILESAGVETERVSTDINNNVWRTLKDVITDRRLKRPKNEDLMGEIKSLIDLGRKVDHPPTSGKDLADAFACSVVGAITLGGSESSGSNDIIAGASIFTTSPQMNELALPGELGVSLSNMLPIGMTLEAPLGPN